MPQKAKEKKINKNGELYSNRKLFMSGCKLNKTLDNILFVVKDRNFESNLGSLHLNTTTRLKCLFINNRNICF